MSQIDQEIAGLIAYLGQAGKYELFDAQVKSVNMDSLMMEVAIEEGVSLFDIKLRAVSNGNKGGLIVIPKTGSEVVIAQIRGQEDYILVLASEIDQVIIDSGVKVIINAPETVFNGGGNGGIPISQNIADRLNNIEKDLNALKQVFSSWAPASGDGGAALKLVAASWMSTQLVETKPDDMGNDKITH